MFKIQRVILFFFVFTTCLHASPPQLIVQIIVDQLRGDLLEQYQTQFSTSGFCYLLKHSINYHNAHHPHANTTTCAGHATISTGSYPALHGIINNDWYDRKAHQLVYCMEDLKAKNLMTQHTKIVTPGRSPRNVSATTLSDEMILSKKGRAFGISFKDRSAIALAGHAGKAYWFDTSNGGFVSSDFYLKHYPQWVINWNKHYVADNFEWNLQGKRNTYYNADSAVFHQHDNEFGDTFPHHIAHHNPDNYFKMLSKTPQADKYTADFAEQLIKNERLGLDVAKTDYLGISFSAVDAIGHQYGPHSIESEDNLLVLDKTIAHLIKTLDKHVGLNKVLFVLTADHGITDGPAYLKSQHIDQIKPIKIDELEHTIHHILHKQFDLPQSALLAIAFPYIYLNHEVINEHHLDVQKVSLSIAESLTSYPGIFKTFVLPMSRLPKDWLSEKVRLMDYSERTGDIYLVQPANQSNGVKSMSRISHGSPWNYDSYVPLLFAAPQLTPHTIYRPVETIDIATTLTSLLKIKPPSASLGKPLTEVLDAYQ